MSDGELFYLFFALIYLSECVVWTGRRSICFIGKFLRQALPRRASSSIGGARSGALMLNPFPPLGLFYLAELWPFALTREGVSTTMQDSPNPGAQPPRDHHSIRWQDLGLIGIQGRFLYADGKRIAGLCSARLAEYMADMLRQLRDMENPDDRDALIKTHLQRALSVRNILRKHRLLTSRLRGPRLDCNMLVLIGFLLLPYSYWRFESDPPFWYTLGFMWLLMLKISIEFFVLHKRLYPTLRGDRWQYFIVSLFVPQFAMRSIDAITRNWLVLHHPLAIAQVVSPKASQSTFSFSVLRDLWNPLPIRIETEGISATFHREHLVPRVREFCRIQGIDVTWVEAPPEPDQVETGSEKYCPRCRAQYDSTASCCIDCGDLPIRPIRWKKELGGSE